MEEKKYIEKAKPNQAYFVSPFFFLEKKDSKRRPVQDYRGTNKLMIRDHYPIPLIPPTIAAVKNASIFTKFDVRQGYNNIRIREEDKHKAMFKTEFGVYVPNIKIGRAHV